MVEMAKTNGVNVYHYLTYLLEKQPDDRMSDEELEQLALCNENVKAELKQRAQKPRNGEALLSPSFLLSVYSFGIYIIARNFRSYSRGRVLAEPTKGNNHDALLVMQKNRK